MKILAYTSCSLNYLPKARVLSKSLREHHPDADLYLLLNDDWPHWLDREKEPFTAIWTPTDLGYDRGWVFEHNVMEVCTAVKGRALVRLIDEAEAQSKDLVAYFDPDVCVYSKLESVLEQMGNAEIGLIPHITEPEVTDVGVTLTELSVAAHGTYNLGHLFIRVGSNSKAFAKWWADRLDKYCFDEKEYGLFTDQRWCDMVPALFGGVKVMRVPNMDVASWNVHGRDIVQVGSAGFGQYTINGVPLLTYHFSGTGPTGTHKRVREILAPTSGALASIERNYEVEIESAGQSVLEHWPYAGDYFDDGTPVTSNLRKFFRHYLDVRMAFPDPYSVSSERVTYLQWIRENRPDLLDSIVLTEAQKHTAFELMFDEKYYLSRYPEVEQWVSSERSALDHYCQIGSRLRYDPCVYFDTLYYIAKIRGFDDGRVGRLTSVGREQTWLWHYLSIGVMNRIEPIPFFDSRWYVAQYNDIMEAMKLGEVLLPLLHFQQAGDREGRDPCADFERLRRSMSNTFAANAWASTKLGVVGCYVSAGRSLASWR